MREDTLLPNKEKNHDEDTVLRHPTWEDGFKSFNK